MGLFSTSSKSRQTTNVTTKTTTNIRDIGLTGQNAVDLAAVLSTGAIEQQRMTLGTMDNLVQTVGKSAQQLIGGASNMVETQTKLLEGKSEFSKMVPWIAAAAAAIFIVPAFLKR